MGISKAGWFRSLYMTHLCGWCRESRKYVGPPPGLGSLIAKPDLLVDSTADMASDDDRSDRESNRKSDRFFRRFRSTKRAITTNTVPQIPKSEHSTSDHESKGKRDRFARLVKSSKSPVTTPKFEQYSKADFKPPSENSRQHSLDNQDSSLTVNQTHSLPRIEDKCNHDTAIDDDGCQSQYLWMRAYRSLENRDPDLVAAYAGYLDPTHSSSTIPNLSPKLIEAVIEKRLQDNEARSLVFHLGTESMKVREQGEKIIKFILWSNDFISTAINAQPYAALAWSGVSVLFSLLLNSSKQKEAMLTGLNFITGLLRLYKIRENLYLQAVDKPTQSDFVKAVVDLYTDIFEFQATLILYLSRSSIKRGVRSTFERDDWSGMLKRVQSSNATCTEYTALFDKEKEHRFYTEQSSQIEQSAEVQKHILESFEAFQHTRQQDRQDDKEAALLRTLASDYKSDKDSIAKRVSGTCEWFLGDKRFLDFRDSKKSSVLWISAGPGCGKSVLSRCLIDEKQLSTNLMTSTVCYFFFKDGQEQRSKGCNAISAILHQLFEKKPGSSLAHALSSYRSFGEKLPDMLSELWDILIHSAKDPDAGEIICVLDALDECEKNARKQLVKKIVEFFLERDHLKNASLSLKFLITSRPYEDLEQGFQPISSIDTFTRFDSDEKSERIGQEIHLVIDAKVPHIAGDFSAEDRQSISDRLKKQENRTYLWFFLTMDIIEDFRSKYSKMSSLDELLSGLPASISDAYEKILSKSSDKAKAKTLLQIVVAARRPLTLDEANVALSIATRTEICNSHKTLGLWPSTSFKSTIQNMCGLFISVYDSKLFLIHQTAREFLISPKSHATRSHEWEGSLNMTMAHGTISQICLHYLNLQDFASFPLDQDSDSQKIREEYPFLNYAAQEWPVHYSSQDNELAQRSRKAAGMLCRTSLPQLSYWSPIYRKWEYEDIVGYWTDLGIPSRLGLVHVVEDVLNESNVNIFNSKAGYLGSTALEIASFEGHKKIVEMLLNRMADFNAENERHDTNKESIYGFALRAAAIKGHEKIVEIFLNQYGNVNFKSKYYYTALIEAAQEGHKRIVEMLLNRMVDFNAENELHDTIKESICGFALRAAATGGHEKIVEIFMNQYGNVNAKNKYRYTALMVAAQEGHEKIIEMLFNQNANVHAESEIYGDGLITAATRGHEKIVEMLLNQKADVNAKGGYYCTALIGAAVGGYEKIIEMLLNRNADANVYGRPYGTVLIAASADGHKRAVDLLLDRNAIAGKDLALERASAAGHKEVIEILLKRSPDIDFTGKTYRKSLKSASKRLCVGSVEMLLNKMVDSNVEVEAYDNALEVALKAVKEEDDEVDEKENEVWEKDYEVWEKDHEAWEEDYRSWQEDHTSWEEHHTSWEEHHTSWKRVDKVEVEEASKEAIRSSEDFDAMIEMLSERKRQLSAKTS